MSNFALPILEMTKTDPGIPASSAGSLAPGYEFGYDAITADVTVTSVTEATGTTVISCAAHTFDGQPVWAEFFTIGLQPATAAAALVVVSLFEGSTQLTRLAWTNSPAATAADVNTPTGRYRFQPSVGSHTYTVTAFQSGGNGVVRAGSGGASGSPPAYIRFVKV